MRKNYAPNVQKISSVLKSKYKDFNHYNKKNPLNELLFIILSTKTTEKSYRHIYAQFRKQYSTFYSIGEATSSEIATVLHDAGLSNRKSLAIMKIMHSLKREFGRPTLSPLKRMTNDAAESFLKKLPYVGTKVARCVLMYSLDREVFPVDVHCWRISKRIGWIKASSSDGEPTETDMDTLQDKIPERLRYSLHVNMLSLGREICTAHRPDCEMCPISRYCKKVGL